jgi:hypothetical protein
MSQDADTNSTRNIRIFDTIYSTYSQSFLCYGMNEATLMYQTDLIKVNNKIQMIQITIN